MSESRLAYALVTPAKNDAENLRRLAACVTAQTQLPTAWIVVDDGSTDETPALIADLAASHSWISSTRVPGSAMAPGAPVVRAFNAGYDALGESADVPEPDVPEPDVIVKLDADVSFEPDYFERLTAAFEADPRLGIAGGICFELEDGEWVPRHVTGDHVRGATRAYRAQCLREVGPLPEAVGWDGVDELKANVLGWRTASIEGLRFDHHRSVGERDGSPARRWLAEGKCAHFMGYRFSYLLIRTAGRALRDRDPYAFAMLWGYARASLRREDRYADTDVRDYLRRQQAIRYLPLRVRESLGRR